MFRGVRGPSLQSTLLHARGLWMSWRFKKRFNYRIFLHITTTIVVVLK